MDEDGNPGDGTGLNWPDNISEIIGIDAYCDTMDYLEGRGITQCVHFFLDIEASYSEGTLQGDLASTTPGPYDDADLQWYRNPYGSAGSSLQDKIDENNVCIDRLHARGYSKVVLNLGGERWRGWPGLNGNGPWGPNTGTDADLKFHWLTDHAAPVIQGVVDHIAAQGYTEFEVCVSQLESVSGGRIVPLDEGNRRRNRQHLDYEVSVNGTNVSTIASSNHYRGDFPRWLREPQMRRDGSRGMQYAFITDSGQASWQQAWDYIQATYDKKFLPMANSVGDANTSLVWQANTEYPAGVVLLYQEDGKYYIAQVPHLSDDFANDLAAGKWQLTPGAQDDDDDEGKPPGALGKVSLPQWQRGLVGAQQLIEQILSDIEVAQLFPGIAGDHEHAGFTPSEGLAGTVNGAFTTFPLFHAMKTFGPILQKRPDVLDFTPDDDGIVCLALKWTDTLGRTVVSVWLINKKFTGDPGFESGVAHVSMLKIPDADSLTVSNVRQFTETATTNPRTPDVVQVSGGDRITAALPAFSITSFDVRVTGSGPFRGYFMNERDADIEIVQGENDPPIEWQFLDEDVPDDEEPTSGDILDLTDSVLYLTIYKGATVLVDINSDDDTDQLAVDLANGILTWTPPLATTRLLPVGRIARYEVERRTGSGSGARQGRTIKGSVVVSEGKNPDD